MFKLRGKLNHVRSNWKSKFDVKRLKVKVTGAEQGTTAYRVGQWGRSELFATVIYVSWGYSLTHSLLRLTS